MGSINDISAANKRRDFTRVLYSSDVVVNHANRVICGKVSNVSLKGLHLNILDSFAPDDSTVSLTVCPAQGPSMSFQAKVVWAENSEFGMEICKMPVESFTWLRNIISNRVQDPDGVINEVYKVARCIE